MPSLRRNYVGTLFTADVLHAAFERFGSKAPAGVVPEMSRRTVEIGRDRWTYDSDSEFLAAVRGGTPDWAVDFTVPYGTTPAIAVSVRSWPWGTELSVEAPSAGEVLDLIEPFDRSADACRLPSEPVPPAEPPTIFIAHGRSDAWKVVRDELHKHGYSVEAYEQASRSGMTITDVLGQMFGKAGFGVAVLTAEDAQGNGSARARQNVIHETGYMHGALGVSRVAILMESDVEQFTNIAGVQYIAFRAGEPIVAMSDLLAHIRREYPGN